ncbi:MAG: DUF1576 domain-containing protein [Cellulosilyticum sp.]|nr:DUF1576 domain-containing protein [Cellulosilyticum sp.]
MIDKNVQDIEQKQLKYFCMATIVLFFVVAFCLTSPTQIIDGMKTIVISRDALITDYFMLADHGTAFFNSALMMTLVMGILQLLKMPFTGLTLAALFINGGFALFGKNPISVLPIFLGTSLYAWQQGVHVKRYIYTGLFGACLAPLVTEMYYILPFGHTTNLIAAIMIGIIIGFILPGLAIHTTSMHMGYNLFNVGFAAGIIGFIVVSILKGFGLQIESVMIWYEGRPVWLICLLYVYFIATFIYGLWINKWNIKPIRKIFHHPGRAVADFILMDGVGITLVNMSLTGCFCLTYIILVGGDLSGPMVGAILTLFGFSAFGIHLKNYIPCMLGVFLGTLFKIYTPTMPAIQLATMFCAGLAPIAGQFGVIAGILAGLLHTSVVTQTGQLYSGLNLYNNGFSTGFVAIFMIPLLESFMKRFKKRNFGS